MVIKTKKNALETFVSKTKDLFASEPDLDKRWEALTPILSDLIADPAVIAASKNWPDCVFADDRAENLLFYVDDEYGFAINGLTKNSSPTSKPQIHDHAHIYTLYGVLDGKERVDRYDRLDDRSQPDYAEIKLASSVEFGPGEIDLVRPYEIHTENTIGERTVAVIIRSQMSATFNQGRYQPETNGYYQGLGPRQTPVEMFTEA